VAEQAYAYVTLIPVAKGFQSAIAKEMGGVEDVGAKAGKAAGSGFKGNFLGAIKGFAGPIAAGIGAAAIGNFVKNSVTAASDLGESLNAVSVSYGEATNGIIALGETAANRLGLSQEAFNSISTQFSGFASNIAGEGGDVVNFIDELSTRGADFASVYNLEVNDALAIFQSGLAGETEPLRKFGVDLSAATVEAYAYANGIGEIGTPLTEAQKQQARYGALLEQTNKVQGDFGNTSDGLANSQRILAANFDNLQADLGSVLVPILADVTSAMVPMLDVIKNIFGFLQENGPVVAGFAGAIGLLTIAVNAQRIATAAWAAVQTVLNFVLSLNPIGIIIVAIGILTAAIVYLATKTQFFQTVWQYLTDFFQASVQVMSSVFTSFVDFLSIAWDGIKLVFTSVLTFISDAFKSYINGWISLFEGFVNGAIRGVNWLIRALNKISFSLPSWVPGIGGKSFGVNIAQISSLNLPRLAEGGFVDSPTTALIGEAGPEVVIPLDRFEKMVGLDSAGNGRAINYYAAPNKSFDAEQELRLAMTRARVLA
jgi:hypothetical protein